MIQILTKNGVSLKNSRQIEYIPLVVLRKCYAHILEGLQVLLGEGGDKIRQLAPHQKECFCLDKVQGWGILPRPINVLGQKPLYRMLPHIDEIDYKIFRHVPPRAKKLISL